MEIKRRMIGNDETTTQNVNKIDNLSLDLNITKDALDALDRQHAVLMLDHSKMNEAYTQCQLDLEDTVNKVHASNKARHQSEILLDSANAAGNDLDNKIE